MIVCSACKDTHWVSGEDWGPFMCTRCPRPCEQCRSRGPGKAGGPYCAVTPCECGCHKGKKAPADPVGALAKELAALVGRGLPGDPKGLLERLSVEYEGEIQQVDAAIERGRKLLRSLRVER